MPDFIDEQHPAWLQFLHSCQQGIHHAWLITGPRGAGKTAFIQKAALHLLSSGAARHEHAKLLRQGAHPDAKMLGQRDINGELDAASLRADGVREVGQFFRMKPAISQWRVAAIQHAEMMNKQAANAVLKILEEPPPQAVIFLSTHVPGVLLPTLRSRCRVLKIQAPTRQQIFVQLQRQFTDTPSAMIEWAIGASHHNLSVASMLIKTDAYHIHQQLDDLCAQLPAFNYGLAASIAQKFTNKDDKPLECLILLLKNIVQQAAASCAGVSPLFPWHAHQSLSGWLQVWDEYHQLERQVASLFLDPKTAAYRALALLAVPR
ncbi:MAG: hypothetical protein EBQ89_04490 [Alphaproteobacteria bacterium]|nr:hypothetical protein [Alphaproteobacteria bacterium]